MMLQNLSIRARLLLLVAVQSSVLSVAFLFMFVDHVDDSSVADTQAQTRRVSAMADSVRSEMSSKWKAGVFDQRMLAQWAREGHDDKILAAVPIVTAWEAVMATSEEGGYEFRTPNFNPRNLNNEPDPIESKALNAFKTDPSLQEFVIIDDVANTMRHFSPIRLEQECMICHGDPKTSMELWGNDKGLDPTGHVMDDYKVGDLHGAFEVIQSMDQADQRARTAVISGMVLMILILVPSLVLISWLIHRSVVRPLVKTVDAMKSIASGDGDLTLRLHDRGRSEVAMLGHWFNRFAERIEGVVIGISGSAATLGEATGVVLKSAQDVRGSAFQSKSQSTTISSAAEELSITMNNIAISTNEVSDKLARVSMAVSNVDDSIKGIAKNAEEGESVSLAADQVVRQSQSEIRSMSEVTEKIGDIVTAIQDIAEQTNLLALNATIEAARAGESGKGFAVVASEVKALAKQTAMATDHIRDQISQVQDRADQAVRSVDSIKDIVTRVHQLNQTIAASVEEQRQTVASIAVDVDDAAASGKAVSEQIGEVAAASREITESITNVDSELQGTAASAQASLDSGERLLVLAQSMQDVVSRFRVSQSMNHTIRN